MDALRITGGATLSGRIAISGSKNAGLPVLAATLLSEGSSTLHNLPQLADVLTMERLLMAMGASVVREGSSVTVNASHLTNKEAPYELVRTMRASILVLGPLLARYGEAKVSLPGGCAIGARPIDQHLKGLERMGASISIEHGFVVAKAKRLQGAEISFDMPTVGGTENLMLAASLAEGTTVLHNAAREPEIVDLAEALTAAGVEISGAGSASIVIHGGKSVGPIAHSVVADRIEFGTFLVAGAMAGQGLLLSGGRAEHQAALIARLREAGVAIDVRDNGDVEVSRAVALKPLTVHTAPYPGFPTDMQAQLMALLTLADGTSVVSENIFENRFMHVPELDRLGADIRVEGGKAVIRGVKRLSGTTVMATDLRASACLVLAGLVAEGETVVRRVYHLDRGYEQIGGKLSGAGARIERFSE